jgi:hypothetical protein
MPKLDAASFHTNVLKPFAGKRRELSGIFFAIG